MSSLQVPLQDQVLIMIVSPLISSVWLPWEQPPLEYLITPRVKYFRNRSGPNSNHSDSENCFWRKALVRPLKPPVLWLSPQVMNIGPLILSTFVAPFFLVVLGRRWLINKCLLNEMIKWVKMIGRTPRCPAPFRLPFLLETWNRLQQCCYQSTLEVN